MPTVTVKLLNILAILAYASSALTTLANLRRGGRRLVRVCLLALGGGVVLNLAVVVLRIAHDHSPASSGFDVFSLLAMLMAVVAMYLKAMDVRRTPELVLAPLAGACLLVSLVLSDHYRDFARGVWTTVHVLFAIGGMVCLGAAAAGGAIYLRIHGQLRRKDPQALSSPWPSLERIDRFMRHMLPIGFALLTVTILLGLVGVILDPAYLRNWPSHPKVLLAMVAWVLYAVALHSTFARRFRGRQVATFSIVGFVLLVVVLLVGTLI